MTNWERRSIQIHFKGWLNRDGAAPLPNPNWPPKEIGRGQFVPKVFHKMCATSSKLKLSRIYSHRLHTDAMYDTFFPEPEVPLLRG